MRSELARRGIFIAFLTEAILAGGNSVAIRFINRELDPLWGASLRFGLAAVLLAALMAARRQPVPRGRALAGAVLFGLLQFAGAFGLYHLALVDLQAGLGQTLLALVPLATVALAVGQRQERLNLRILIGAVLGIVGVAVILREHLAISVPTGSLLAVGGSVLCFAQALIVVRRFPGTNAVAMNFVGITVSVPILVAASVFRQESLTMPARPESWIALAYLGAVGSVVVFLLHVIVAQRWSASRAAYVMVLVPFVTVLLSAWLDQEPITPSLVVGGSLVIFAVYVGALSRPERAIRRQFGADTTQRTP